MISVISWRIAGSDGYQRHFDREDEALEAFSKVTVMVNRQAVVLIKERLKCLNTSAHPSAR
jgi:hypothetical protein